MTRPVRVALDATAVPANPRGVGRMAIDLTSALVQRPDVEVTVLARASDASRWEALSPHAVVARAPGPRPIRLAWEQMALPRLLRRLSVDVHHGTHYTMPERARLPKVVTVHDMTFFDHPEWHERAKVPFFQRAIRVASRSASAIVCASQATADRLEAVLAPAVPVHVVHHGVDTSHFRAEEPSPGADDAVLTALGATAPYVFFVGTLEPRKNVPSLVRAFDRVAATHPDLSLVVAGGAGWGVDAIDAAVARARFASRIHRLGYVDDAAVPALLRRAAAVAYPSLEEGFGLPALEALACGAPLVTTSGSSMEEVTGDAAVLVPVADDLALAVALEEVLAGGPAVLQRRRAGVALAAAATWDAAAAAYTDVYRSVIAESR